MTPEEMEKLLAQKDGQNKALSDEIETLKNGFANSTTEITDLKDKLKRFEDKERAQIEEAARAIDAKKELAGMSNELILAWIDGVNEGRKAIEATKGAKSAVHGTGKAPPLANKPAEGAANSTNPNPITKGLLHSVGKGFISEDE